MLTTRIFGAVTLAFAFACGTAQAASLGSAPGFGTAQPSAVNQSLDSRFSIYRWDVGGSKLFQVNDAHGQVLLTFIETEGQVSRLSVGALSGQVRINGAKPSAGNQALDAASGTCPCASSMTYDDGHARIIMTTDSQGRVLDLTVSTTSRASSGSNRQARRGSAPA
ncbi:hypothetical protein ACS5PK_20790 [Roseateles sp. DB2]|uniref:hypothetical protein n=1 Tax=Roseateles sp. DB2 TaxID=3453717 RepID=UPI003EEAC6DC